MVELPKVQHLVLLVGSNPLPNAVAGKLLVRSEGAITLVHSRDSSPVAQRLKQWLEKEHQKKDMVKLKQVKESDPSSVYQGVWACLEDVQAESIGLNYTGGTKMMSVHAYLAAQRWAEGRGIAPVFSYLDAHTLQMVFDPVGGGASPRRIYVGRKVTMRLEDLLTLHGWSLSHHPVGEPLLPHAARALAQSCSREADFYRQWKHWVNQAGREAGRLREPEDRRFREIYEILRQELGQPEGEIGLKHLIFKNAHQNFPDWLTGKWLEHHVLDVLNHMQDSLGLHERVQNLQTSVTQFEVDVVAVRGYQLFAFSCKAKSDEERDGRAELKLALFEAYVRAQQLGGEEARVALVCCAEDPQSIEREMQRDLDTKGRTRVFGRRDLGDLASYVDDWIRSQSGEEG